MNSFYMISLVTINDSFQNECLLMFIVSLSLVDASKTNTHWIAKRKQTHTFKKTTEITDALKEKYTDNTNKSVTHVFVRRKQRTLSFTYTCEKKGSIFV